MAAHALFLIDIQPAFFREDLFETIFGSLKDRLETWRDHNTQIIFVIQKPAPEEELAYIKRLMNGGDKIFFQPDGDAIIENAVTKTGMPLMQFVKDQQFDGTIGIIGGTYYGGVSAAYQQLEEDLGLKPVIIHDYTDYRYLTPDDLAEVQSDPYTSTSLKICTPDQFEYLVTSNDSFELSPHQQ